MYKTIFGTFSRQICRGKMIPQPIKAPNHRTSGFGLISANDGCAFGSRKFSKRWFPLKNDCRRTGQDMRS